MCRWINRQGGNLNAAIVEPFQLTLQLTELHITSGSPVAPVENDNNRALISRRLEIKSAPATNRECEIRRLFTNRQSIGCKQTTAIAID